MNTHTVSTCPDIATEEKPEHPALIQKVGMEKVSIPIKIESHNTLFHVPALFDLQVNVTNPNAKGIHMSRLYKQALQSFEETTFSVDTIFDCLKKMIAVS